MPVFPCKLSRWLNSGISFLVVGCVVFQVAIPSRSLLQAQEIEQVSFRKAVQKIAPAYPEIAKTLKLSGKVRIIAKVAPSGKVVATEIVGGHPVLAKAAADAVLQWRYEPGPQQTSEIAIITFQP